MNLRTIAVLDFILLLVASATVTSGLTLLISGTIDFAAILIVESIVIIIWIVCGILTYGLRKNFWKNWLMERQCPCYGRELERLCVSTGMFGVVGLIGAFADYRKAKYPLGLCFKMPQELCGPFPGKNRK